MSFSAVRQAGPRNDKAHTYASLPISPDIEQGQEDKAPQSYDCDEFCGTTCQIVKTTIGFIALIFFCVLASMYYDNLESFSNLSPPKFFVQSLRVPTFNISDGELSAKWDVNLIISNDANSTLVNFLDFQAFMVYKENETLALNSSMECQHSMLSGIFAMKQNENKTVHLELSTTGWEKDQPMIDDNVLQEIAEDRKRGVLRFGLRMMVKAEFVYDVLTTPVLTMYPYCSDLEVEFAPLQRGEPARWVNGQPKECFVPIESSAFDERQP